MSEAQLIAELAGAGPVGMLVLLAWWRVQHSIERLRGELAGALVQLGARVAVLEARDAAPRTVARESTARLTVGDASA